MAVKDRYKLLFKWEGIRYERDIASFKKSWFEGPVLKIAAQIEQDSFMGLDFTKQNRTSNLFLPNHYFIARLQWRGVTYKDGIVDLANCTLTHEKAGSLKNIEDDFTIEIDCSAHEEYFHRKTLVYPALILNKDDQPI